MGDLKTEPPPGALICPFLSTIVMMPQVKAAVEGGRLMVVDQTGPLPPAPTPLRVPCIREQCAVWYEERQCCSFKRKQL